MDGSLFQKTRLGCFLVIPDAWTAEMIASRGFDVITLDMQHGLIDFRSAVSIFQALQWTGVDVFVRLNANDSGHIMQMLDIGAKGLICPMIETVDDVRRFIEVSLYPPEGKRSFGPIRAEFGYAGNYRETANSNIVKLAMVETAGAMKHLEEIAQVPGLSGLFVGPYDLSISMGFEKLADIYHPPMKETLQKVVATCNKHHLIPGIFTANLNDIPALKELGFQFVAYHTDMGLLCAKVREDLEWLGKNMPA
jgi:4-hydroxy-2-oxoheptanedioate aldolase